LLISAASTRWGATYLGRGLVTQLGAFAGLGPLHDPQLSTRARRFPGGRCGRSATASRPRIVAAEPVEKPFAAVWGRAPTGRGVERPAGGLEILLPRRHAWQLSDTISISVTRK